MECINCGKEFEAKRSTSKYCSAKCRKLAFQKVSVLSVPVVSVPYGQAVIGVPGDDDYNGCMELVSGNWQQKARPNIPLSEYSREQLENYIRHYEANTWINSPEHKELTRRQHTMTIEQLETNGYSIPVWKRAEHAA